MGRVLKIGLTVGLLGLIAAKLDFAALARPLKALTIDTVLLCLAISLLQITLLAFRWSMVAKMGALNLPWLTALRCTMASQLFGQGLPASVGADGLRVWWLTRVGMPFGPSLRNVVLDRMSGLLALLLFNVFAVALLVFWLGLALQGRDALFAMAAPMAILGIGSSRVGRIVLFAIYRGLRRGLSRWEKPRQGVRKLFLALSTLQKACGALLWSRAAPRLMTVGVAIHAMGVVIAWLVVRDIGVDISLVTLFAIFPPVILVAYLPISIGGWGVREGAAAFAFTMVGQSPELGVFVGLALGLFTLAGALVGAVFWLGAPLPPREAKPI